MIHQLKIGFFAEWEVGISPRVVRRLTADDVHDIEQSIAARFNRVVELKPCLTGDGFLSINCFWIRDFEDFHFAALAAYDLLHTNAGEHAAITPEEMRGGVRKILARDAEVKRIRAIADVELRLAAVFRAMEQPCGSGMLSWPHTFHALGSLNGKAVPVLVKALAHERRGGRRTAGMR